MNVQDMQQVPQVVRTVTDWSFEHPYLWTIIELNPPAILIIAYIVVKLFLGFLTITDK